jgi:hypothetical protein
MLLSKLEEKLNQEIDKVEKYGIRISKLETKVRECALADLSDLNNRFLLAQAEGDLENTKKKKKEHEDKIAALQNKINAIKKEQNYIKQIPEVEKFLTDYKNKCLNFENDNFEKCKKLEKEWNEETDRILDENNIKYGNDFMQLDVYERTLERKKMYEVLDKNKHSSKDLQKLIMENSSYGTWAFFYDYGSFIQDEDKWNQYISDNIETDIQAKRKLFYYRIAEKAGNIQKAAVNIGNNGELNGIVYGDKAAVTVETITAGGYNIQRRHFRVLVHIYKHIQNGEYVDNIKEE